jgi:outer membrane biosynthesis protein TonB
MYYRLGALVAAVLGLVPLEPTAVRVGLVAGAAFVIAADRLAERRPDEVHVDVEAPVPAVSINVEAPATREPVVVLREPEPEPEPVAIEPEPEPEPVPLVVNEAVMTKIAPVGLVQPRLGVGAFTPPRMRV